MAEIVLDGVTKHYPGGAVAVHRMDLAVADGEFVILVGPSGCGKSTTLNMIAGLEEITRGELRIGGRVVNGVPPKDRDIAMVFQNYALYPHLSVRENLAFPLTLARLDAGVVREKVDRAASALGLTELLERKPAQLSGGQRQRVAMGRAIVRDPQAFLMDEPLSNLDARLRVEMRTQLARLQKRLGTTTVYVTHDQTEAMTLGDRVVVMRAGHVQQIGTPRELYDAPANLFVAGFIGSPAMNILPATVAEGALRTAIGAIPLTDQHRRAVESHGGGREVAVGLRPEAFEDAALAGAERDPAATFTAEVDVLEWMGADVFAYFDVRGMGDDSLVARLGPDTRAREGEPLEMRIDTRRVHLFDADSGDRLGG
ncbi:MAG TPA: sn-glycerol-3-phosphate ABC transporter ATP-binding protein UgpC [Longimicrobiaceae bacterium]|nr:sn-glycerol-3-phosphate ABC transporter ATP-binding protein UgpC [Longimicrobiaceae bacterium]